MPGLCIKMVDDTNRKELEMQRSELLWWYTYNVYFLDCHVIVTYSKCLTH